MQELAHETEPVEFRQGDVTLRGERWPALGETRRGSILLLHGGGQTRHSWSGTAQRISSSGWTTIAVDLRGHGDSSWSGDARYGLFDYAADIDAIVSTLDEPPVIVGASLGGLTALAFASTKPDKARGIVLVDIAPRMSEAGTNRVSEFMERHLDGFTSLGDVATAVSEYNPHRRAADPAGLRKNVRQRSDGRWYWHWDPRVLDSGPSRPGASESRFPDGDELVNIASRIRVPTLLIRGELSDVVDEAAVEEFLSIIPLAVAVEVPGTGHMVAGDDNDAFAAAVLAFLEGMD